MWKKGNLMFVIIEVNSTTFWMYAKWTLYDVYKITVCGERVQVLDFFLVKQVIIQDPYHE